MSAPRGRRWLLAAVVTTVVAAPAAAARASTPTEQLRVQIDQVIKVLEDGELRKAGRATERRAAIRRIAGEIFDFTEMTRRSLGPHWQTRTPAEREEITRLFADLLERSYISKIERYSGEKIVYLGDSVDGDYATVRAKLLTRQGMEIPLDYRMLRRGERWFVYDVSIEGVSLVANYRAQFNKIIQASGYTGLVQKLREKQADGMGLDAAVLKTTSESR